MKENTKEVTGKLWVLPCSREYEISENGKLFFSGKILSFVYGCPSKEELEEFIPGSVATVLLDAKTDTLLKILEIKK